MENGRRQSLSVNLKTSVGINNFVVKIDIDINQAHEDDDLINKKSF